MCISVGKGKSRQPGTEAFRFCRLIIANAKTLHRWLARLCLSPICKVSGSNGCRQICQKSSLANKKHAGVSAISRTRAQRLFRVGAIVAASKRGLVSTEARSESPYPTLRCQVPICYLLPNYRTLPTGQQQDAQISDFKQSKATVPESFNLCRAVGGALISSRGPVRQ